MQIYKYSAKDEQGKTLKGKVEARDEKQAVSIIRGRNLVVVSLKKTGKSGDTGSSQGIFNRVTSNDLVQFTQQLATMQNSGLPLTDALDLLMSQSKPGMQAVLGEILKDVQGGMSLGDAMSRHKQIFSGVYIALVRAGEAAGKLDEILVRLAENEEKRREFRQKTKGALIYPVIVVMVMILVVIVMMVFVVPQLTEMYDSFGAELPLVTQILMAVSDFMRDMWWIMVGVTVAGGYFFVQWRKTFTGREKLDRMALKIPVFGPLRVQTILTEFARTLALLVNAGISILESLEIVGSSVENVVFEKGIKVAAKGVEKGMPLAAMLARQQIFPPILSQMMAVGEETGELDSILNKVADYFEQEVEHKIKNLTTAIEPIIMVVLGVMVAIIVMAIISPLYKLTELF